MDFLTKKTDPSICPKCNQPTFSVSKNFCFDCGYDPEQDPAITNTIRERISDLEEVTRQLMVELYELKKGKNSRPTYDTIELINLRNHSILIDVEFKDGKKFQGFTISPNGCVDIARDVKLIEIKHS